LLHRYTRWAVRHPLRVLAAAVLVLSLSWGLASQLRIKGDFVSLLPTESGTAQRFRAALERKSAGASTLIVVMESPDAASNQRFVDALAAKLRGLEKNALGSVQTGTEAERKFFQDYRWLFASERDLMLISCELSREREQQSLGLGLDEPCDTEVDDELKRLGLTNAAKPSALIESDGPTEPAESPEAASPENSEQRSPLSRIRRRIEQQTEQYDRFKSNYFANAEGTRYALVIRTSGAGMGELDSDQLLQKVNALVAELEPARYHAATQVGFAGDIPNAVAERKSLIQDIALVSSLAGALILTVILGYFRSPLSLLHIGLATVTGCGIAFAVAKLAFGHLNMATGFLGSIIAGNGINISMIYFARYRELRGEGEGMEQAVEQAALDCRRGTWLGAMAAAGAYAALGVTSFRGFSEFGLIGGAGSVACWVATFCLCPASIGLVEGLRSKSKSSERAKAPVKQRDPFVTRRIAWLVVKKPAWVLVAAGCVAAALTFPIARYVSDPWEYDFGKLRSVSSSSKGAGHFSSKADEIFRTRGSPDLLLADDMSQASAVADAIWARDRKLFGSKLVERVLTVHDYLGGRPDSVQRKLAILNEVREEMDRVLPRLTGDNLEFARSWRPPESLRALGAEDLPPLLRERFTEVNGRFGTAVYVEIDRKLSRSKGEHLLKIADLLEGVRGPGGQVVPNASRATVFAEMIRSMTRDAPRSMAVAFGVVVVVCSLATGALVPLIAVVGSLLLAVWLTLGLAANLDVRLNFLNFVALPLTFGIGVEYAINLNDRIRALNGQVSASIQSVGGAIAACSMTTMLGYGTLLIGDNLALRSFGKYAVFGELSCLLTALFVMPAGLSIWQRMKSRRT